MNLQENVQIRTQVGMNVENGDTIKYHTQIKITDFKLQAFDHIVRYCSVFFFVCFFWEI